MRLYGAFRQYQDSVTFTVPSGSRVAAIKDALGQALGPQARNLVADSVIANDTTILPPGFVADRDISLSVLPPVCGG
jgi:hypothetical protein